LLKAGIVMQQETLELLRLCGAKGDGDVGVTLSYRKYLDTGAMTLEDFIGKAVGLKLDGVDMTAYYLKSTEPEYLDGLRHLAYKNAMPLSGSACGVSMVQDRPFAIVDYAGFVTPAPTSGTITVPSSEPIRYSCVAF